MSTPASPELLPSDFCVDIVSTKTGLLAFSIPHYQLFVYGFKRIFGYQAYHGHAVFPAFPPFGIWAADDINKVFPDIPWTEYALDVVEEIKEAVESVKNATWPSYKGHLLDDLQCKSYQHQQEGTVRAFYYPRCGLFFHPGLGKTKTTIDALRLLRAASEPTNTLVLCPTANIALNWKREFDKHAPGMFNVHPLATKSGATLPKARRELLYKKIDPANSNNVLAMSFALYVRDFEHLNHLKLDISILDESHYLMSPTSKRTKAILDNLKTRRRIVLSGTPNMGNPMHLFGQLTFLSPVLTGNNSFLFKRRFCEQKLIFRCRTCGKISPGKYVRKEGILKHEPPSACHCTETRFSKIHTVVGYQNLKALATITSFVALRKRQEECADLPPQTIIDVPITPDKEMKENYNALVKENYDKMEQDDSVHNVKGGARVIKALQVLSGFIGYDDVEYPHGPDFPVVHKKYKVFKKQPKLERLKELLTTIFADESNKVIIWAFFIKELDLIEDLLVKEFPAQGYVRVDGSTTKRTALEDKFNNNPACRVYLSQMNTGIGITLNAANYTVYAGWTYDLRPYIQSRERNYRIGQTRSVTVYRLHVPGSLHDAVLASMETKENIAEALTERYLCLQCKHQAECLLNHVSPFTEKCKVCPDRIVKPKFQPNYL